MVTCNHVDLSQELYKYSVEGDAMAWKKLDMSAGVTGTGPSARYGHTMTSVETDIYIFGGQTNSGESKTRLEGRGGEEGRWLSV